MRGTLLCGFSCKTHHGIIPAHAGNTWGRGHNGGKRWDHPRACGEHALMDATHGDLPGSSPRMRGTLYDAVADCGVQGIIPAHAGNTVELRGILNDSRDHPRACGEHSPSSDVSVILTGSSPRMRGTHLIEKDIGMFRGIIPAHAGNTRIMDAMACSSRDHPRACGEHIVEIGRASRLLGSSPRMRGTHPVGIGPVETDGIIPAHAGNTGRVGSFFSQRRDHPRACGEHIMQSGSKRSQPGSSPRMRGTRVQ